jgi:hypothetical protein
MLSIAHKYCMERIVSDIVEELKENSTYDGFVDLVVASQIIDSDALHQDGVQRLVSSGQPPSKEQAKRMGSEATHTVMLSVMDTLKKSTATQIASVRSEMNAKLVTANLEKDREVAAIRSEMTAALAKVDNTKCRFCFKHTQWSCSYMYCHKVQTIPANN